VSIASTLAPICVWLTVPVTKVQITPLSAIVLFGAG
jgi:hypothetical protein